jgi:hypothetical protein
LYMTIYGRRPRKAILNPRHEGSHAPTLGDIGAPRGNCGFRCHPDAPLSWFLIGRKTIERIT